jgi:ATP-dependent Lhr-like helicase
MLPQFLGRHLCAKIREILAGEDVPPYLTPEAAAALAELRSSMAGLTDTGRGAIEVADDELRWWTFAGGRINQTLRHALGALHSGWKIVPDNFLIKIRGEGLTRRDLEAAIAQINEPEFWENDRMWRDIADTLPAYRLSKFQPIMPPWIEREILARYLLDLRATWRWLTGQGLSRAPDLAASPPSEPVPPRPTPAQPAQELTGRVRWIADERQLRTVCEHLAHERVLGLDVETTIYTQILCLIQIATPDVTYLIDGLAITDLSPLAQILGDPSIHKVIHNATFERTVLARYDLRLDGVVDTLVVSRQRRGKHVEGLHSLRAVCARELGLELDKTDQKSDWSQRPLTPSQHAYAALDAEVLLRLHAHFGAPTPASISPQTRLPGT